MKKILFLCCVFLSLFCHAETKKKPFEDVHPYAFYYLSGGDFQLPDINYPILGINVSKLKIAKHCQELENKKSENLIITILWAITGRKLMEHITEDIFSLTFIRNLHPRTALL